MRPPPSISRSSFLVLALIAPGLAVGGAFAVRHYTTRTTETAAAAPVLDVDPRDLDFGEVWETDAFAKSIRVRNRGQQPVSVTPLNPSCGCAGSEAKPVAIPPGESAEVRYTLDLRGACMGSTPGSSRPVTLPLGVAVDPPSPEAKVIWPVKGHVKPVLSLPVRIVDLGKVPAAKLPEPRTIPLQAWVPLSTLNATVEGNGFMAQLRASAEPQKWELVVSRLSGLPPSRYAGTIRLTMTSTTGETLPPIALPVEFELLGDVTSDSAVLTSNPAPLGSTFIGKLTFSSFSGRPFELSKWTSTSPSQVEIVPESKSGSTLNVEIRQCIALPGDQSNRISFIGKDSAGTTFTIIIEVRYYGLAS